MGLLRAEKVCVWSATKAVIEVQASAHWGSKPQTLNPKHPNPGSTLVSMLTSWIPSLSEESWDSNLGHTPWVRGPRKGNISATFGNFQGGKVLEGYNLIQIRVLNPLERATSSQLQVESTVDDSGRFKLDVAAVAVMADKASTSDFCLLRLALQSGVAL